MDRTVTSDANLQWLRTTGRRYLVGTPRASGARGREIAATNHWQQRPQWRSQTVPGPVGHETFRLTHDAFAEGIERAWHARAAASTTSSTTRSMAPLQTARQLVVHIS